MLRFHWFRFSLRQMTILVTLVCIVCAGWNEFMHRRRAREHVRDVLERPHPPSRILYTFSTVGQRASELISYDDHARLVAELLSLLNDPTWRSDNRGEAVRALSKLSEAPGVVEEMLALVDLPHLGTVQLTVISELRNVKREHQLVIKRLMELRHSNRERVRQNAYHSLEAIAYRHRDFAEAISAVLIEALQDPSESIRSRAAATLGGLPHPDLADALRTALDDKSDLVRLGAARSLRKVTGEDDLLVRIASDILWDEEAAFEAKQQAIDALRNVDDIPQETIDVLCNYAPATTEPVPFSQRRSMSYRLGRAARRLLSQKGVDHNFAMAAQVK